MAKVCLQTGDQFLCPTFNQVSEQRMDWTFEQVACNYNLECAFYLSMYKIATIAHFNSCISPYMPTALSWNSLEGPF